VCSVMAGDGGWGSLWVGLRGSSLILGMTTRYGIAGDSLTGMVGDNVRMLLHVEQFHGLRVQHLSHALNNNISQMHPKMKPAGQPKCQPKHLEQKHVAHPTSHKDVVWCIQHPSTARHVDQLFHDR
jgi:hypothetical protein